MVLSKEAKIGIIVGSIAGFIVITLVIWWICYVRRKRKKAGEYRPERMERAQIQVNTITSSGNVERLI
ncbi:Oidioi.mRNA.OKI2018_I69.chr2.g7374.t1.cds [Oikopleura dioica]|uniref:Oidioi.mRNA.OKI2018_I69.chr2.g7374.t1.cds n=1 Tax=Oikopleura dioica TaxID=34765 RepID=A0ABN7TBZ2_OIKDI|nr:Oidioi.mRNA.OKI2018_I69.chr2.g7374.t1.cds [Oikopleura dioica]